MRAEILAAIAALLRPGAVHPAVDNAALEAGLAEAMCGLRPPWRRPWGLVPDGDAWAYLYEA
eukprot:5170320-Alexandrium_andersonii.AAC.1